MAIIFYASIFKYRLSDKTPDLKPYTPSMIAEFGPFSAQVQTGLYIRDFSVFDVNNNRFKMDAIVWFEFDPNDILLSTIEKFSFINGTIDEKSAPDIKKKGNKIFVAYEVKVSFQTELDFYHSPFDSHRLSIILVNFYATPRELILKTHDTGFNISPLRHLSNWRLDDWTTDFGYSVAEFDKSDDAKRAYYPEAIFLIDFSNIGIKNILILFVPILFALLLGLFSLLVPYGLKEGRESNALMFSLASAAVASLLAYRFVIQTIMPNVGYATILDQVFMICLIVTTFIFLIQIIFFLTAIRRIEEGPNPQKALDAVNFACMVLFFVLSVLVLYNLYTILLH